MMLAQVSADWIMASLGLASFALGAIGVGVKLLLDVNSMRKDQHAMAESWSAEVLVRKRDSEELWKRVERHQEVLSGHDTRLALLERNGRSTP